MFLQYSNTALNIIFPLILFPYMTRTLGPAGYGVIGFYESMLLVVNVLAAFGVNYFGLRLLSKTFIGDNDQSNTVLHLLLINVLMAALGVLAYLGYVLNKPVQIGSRQITYLYAFIMLVYMLHADWYFQSQERYRFLLMRTFLLRLFVVVTTLLLVKSPENLHIYIIINAINYFLLAGSAIWNMRDLFSHWKWDPALFRKLLRSLLPFALMGVLSSLYFTLDTILLARTGEVAALGQYTVAAKIVRLGLNVFIGASIVFFVKLFRSDVNEELQTDSLSMTINLSFPISAVLFCFSPQVIDLVVGSHYKPALELLQIFSLLWLVVPLHDFFNIQVLLVHHKEQSLVILYAMAGIVSLLLNLAMIPIWFTRGAAWAIVITETAVLIAAIILSWPYYRINPKTGREIVLCLAAFPLAYGTAVLAAYSTSSMLLQLILGLSSFGILYLFWQIGIAKSEFWQKLLKLALAKMPARSA